MNVAWIAGLGGCTLPEILCLRAHRAVLYVRFVGPLRFLWCPRCQVMR